MHAPLLGKSACGTRCLVVGLGALTLLNDWGSQKGHQKHEPFAMWSLQSANAFSHSSVIANCRRSLQSARAPAVACKTGGAAVLGTASSPMVGYVACLVAALCFGSCNIPVKRTNVRDGMFFTLCKAGGVLAVGITQWLIAGRYRFEPLAMFGGVLWATGNLFVPFIVQRCGLGKGQLMWGVTSMLLGWASGTFGLFGKNIDAIGNPLMNYVGVSIAVLSLGFFSFMKKETAKGESSSGGASTQAASEKWQLLQGYAAAVAAGCFLGLNFNPSSYLAQLGQLDKAAGLPLRHSINPADYVISHYCGIFATSAVYFLIYCALSRNRFYGKEVVFPGIASGIMWGIAQMAWFTANGVLSYVVAFPIIVTVPGVISALWGVALFGENSGRRNLSLLGIVIILQAVGVTLIAMSKGIPV
ncbi:unnamed protein product [Polarella glacialis]|uniref:Transmembrane protein 144 n=1 Tax=Polarella glacialis TaxID=89957 RepID=A0A813G1T7_POLGL|nr:unnamed protein product [Polarella glacialis]